MKQPKRIPRHIKETYQAIVLRPGFEPGWPAFSAEHERPAYLTVIEVFLVYTTGARTNWELERVY